MGSDLFDIFESIVFLMQVDEPGEVTGVGGYDIVFSLFAFSRNVASI